MPGPQSEYCGQPDNHQSHSEPELCRSHASPGCCASGGIVMHRSVAAVLGMIALCVALIAPPVSGQTEAVELRFQLKPDETLRYTVVQSTLAWLSIDVNGVVRSLLDRESRTLLEEHHVTAVDDGGTISFEVTQQETRNTAASGPAKQPRHWTEKVQPNGEIVQEAGGRGTEYFPIGLPARGISTGESWTYKENGWSWDITKEAGAFLGTDITFTLILASVDRVGEDRIARLQIKGDGQLDMSAAQSTFSGAVAMNGTSPAHVTGEASWSIDRGRLVRLKEETSFEVPQGVTVAGRTYPGKAKFIYTEERELISGPN